MGQNGTRQFKPKTFPLKLKKKFNAHGVQLWLQKLYCFNSNLFFDGKMI